MRLVLDTNVLISAILSPNSISAKILNWGEDNGVILYSAATLNEVLSVLGRSKFVTTQAGDLGRKGFQEILV